MIAKVMERIVTQTIPQAVIDNPTVDWNPFTNKVTASPAAEIEEDAPKPHDDVERRARARHALRACCSTHFAAERARSIRTRRRRRP